MTLIINAKICIIFILIFLFSVTTLNAQAEKESKKTIDLFPQGDPISGLLLKTFFMPVEMLDTEPAIEPELTEQQNELYRMEEIPITLERDIMLLISKKTDQVEYFWSRKDQKWVKADSEIYEYLQGRYGIKDELREKAETHRSLKNLQSRLDELHHDRLGVKSETRPVQ